MISLEVSLKHLAWSNQKFLAYFADLPDEVFDLKAADGEWPIGKLLTHLVGSGQWYRYCLTGVDWTDLEPATNAETVSEYGSIIAELDQVLLDNMKLEDEILTVVTGDESFTVPRSLILAQAPMHAAEHKGQIATIMKQHGHHIDLDSLDVWAFLKETKSS
jgi:uncharacterized damage-inducible protein DinB